MNGVASGLGPSSKVSATRLPEPGSLVIVLPKIQLFRWNAPCAAPPAIATAAPSASPIIGRLKRGIPSGGAQRRSEEPCLLDGDVSENCLIHVQHTRRDTRPRVFQGV